MENRSHDEGFRKKWFRMPVTEQMADIGKEVAEELDELDKMVALRGLMKDLDRAKARADREGWIGADEAERILQ